MVLVLPNAKPLLTAQLLRCMQCALRPAAAQSAATAGSRRGRLPSAKRRGQLVIGASSSPRHRRLYMPVLYNSLDDDAVWRFSAPRAKKDIEIRLS
jgi:hypothetical protein